MIDVIAVDGPTAAGKTTTSRRVAARLGISYLESGRTYRYLAHAALLSGVDLADEHEVTRVADRILDLREYQDVLGAADDRVSHLRGQEVTRAVSRVASLYQVRDRVTEIIRSWARSVGLCVVEGRDIGTTVFPDARVKVFLTAAPEVRAGRRHAQEPGQTVEEVLRDLRDRDRADSTRKHSPLVPAADARTIDTSGMTIDAVVREVLEMADPAACRRGPGQVNP